MEILADGVAAFDDWLGRHQAEMATLARWSQEANEWAARHQEEIAAFAVWAAVSHACEETGVYAPIGPAWPHIADKADRNDVRALEALILTSYAPSGPGYDTLRDDLVSARCLADRQAEVAEVLTSLEDGRHYVAICGALPLVEGVFASTHGRWRKNINDYPLTDRLRRKGALTDDAVSDLILNKSALDMASNGTKRLWQNRRHQAGAFTTILNRNIALHGTGHGWHTEHNALTSVLLLAAVARVAEPLLNARPDAGKDSSAG